MNRQINFRKLRGVIYDHACGLHRYVLNREPAQFRHTQFLVDGSHWTAHKQTTKSKKDTNINSRGGHLGCGSGYNWNAYKNFTSAEVGSKNSQSREQMHSRLDKCGKSFQQKNYKNYCRYMNAFFAISNLLVQNKL